MPQSAQAARGESVMSAFAFALSVVLAALTALFGAGSIVRAVSLGRRLAACSLFTAFAQRARRNRNPHINPARRHRARQSQPPHFLGCDDFLGYALSRLRLVLGSLLSVFAFASSAAYAELEYQQVDGCTGEYCIFGCYANSDFLNGNRSAFIRRGQFFAILHFRDVIYCVDPPAIDNPSTIELTFIARLRAQIKRTVTRVCGFDVEEYQKSFVFGVPNYFPSRFYQEGIPPFSYPNRRCGDRTGVINNRFPFFAGGTEYDRLISERALGDLVRRRRSEDTIVFGIPADLVVYHNDWLPEQGGQFGGNLFCPAGEYPVLRCDKIRLGASSGGEPYQHIVHYPFLSEFPFDPLIQPYQRYPVDVPLSEWIVRLNRNELQKIYPRSLHSNFFLLSTGQYLSCRYRLPSASVPVPGTGGRSRYSLDFYYVSHRWHPAKLRTDIPRFFLLMILFPFPLIAPDIITLHIFGLSI